MPEDVSIKVGMGANPRYSEICVGTCVDYNIECLFKGIQTRNILLVIVTDRTCIQSDVNKSVRIGILIFNLRTKVYQDHIIPIALQLRRNTAYEHIVRNSASKK